MKIDWSAYRITLLLYIGVLFLPISFYFSYTSFKDLQEDTKVLHKLTLNMSYILNLENVKEEKKENFIVQIDTSFQNVEPWIIENNSDSYYVGSTTLENKYNEIITYWKDYKNIADKNIFFREIQAMLFGINKMIELKQNKMYYLFYLNLFITIGFFLVLILFTRVYIHQQLSKHAIYDLKTNLHTKDYLLVTLKEEIAKSIRTKEGLSAIYINVHELQEMQSAEQDKILEYIGTSLLSSLRESDVASRYGEDEFVIILPNTKEEHFDILTNRLTKDLAKIKCKIKATQYILNESHETFLERLI